MSLTPEQRDQLEAVNLRINAIPYNALMGRDEPADMWTDTPLAGESFVCRDYVLDKAKELQADGWPHDSMTVVICWTETDERHAVLAVETGDPSPMILDSRFDEIYRMDAPLAPYRWEARQIAGTTEFKPLA